MFRLFSIDWLTYFTFSSVLMGLQVVCAVKYSTVLIQRNDDIVCAGAFRNKDTIVTAADCFQEGKLDDYTVMINSDKGYTANITALTKHAYEKGNKRNIAMLTIMKPPGQKEVRLHSRIATKVYDDKVLIHSAYCVILDPAKNREISVKILSNSQCTRDKKMKIKDTKICVHRGRNKKKKCPIGVGNPIVCKIRYSKWVQVGVHIDDGCSSGTMIATRLSQFREWMRHPNKKSRKIQTQNLQQSDNLLVPSILNVTNSDSVNPSPLIPNPDDIESIPYGTISNSTNPRNEMTDDLPKDNTTIPVNGFDITDVPVPCNTSEFRCADGTCIPTSDVCNGVRDCPCSGEDESSCGCSLEGTEFITGFLDNVGPEVGILYISAPKVTNVTVSIPFLGYKETREVIQSEKWSFEDTDLIIIEKTSNKGVHISSDKPITVIAANSRESSYSTIDGTLVYPLKCLSTDHLVEVQKHRYYKTSQYAIIGTQVTPTDITIVNRKGKRFTPTLGFLDTYFLKEKDLRGTTITASDKVVVLSGSECGYVPSSMTASCDHLVNQIPARSLLGYTYIISQQRPRTGFTFRVQATDDDTTVLLRDSDGDLIENVTLNVGTEYEKFYLDSKFLSVKANKRIMVTQYAMDAKLDDLGQGDPSMLVLQSLTSLDYSYNFVIPDHHLRVSLNIFISSCHDTSGLRLNGEEISTHQMVTVAIPGSGEYHVITVDLASKWESYGYGSLSHIERDVAFGAYMYGTRVEGAFAWRIGGTL